MDNRELQNTNQHEELEIDLIELFLVLWRSKWLIIGLVIIASFIAGVHGLMQDHEYEVSSSFTVSNREFVATGVDESPRMEISVLMSLLRSNSLAQAVVDDLDLVEVWEANSRAAAARRLNDNINISTNDEQTVITISYRSTDPELTEKLVSSYIDNFKEMYQEVNMTETAQALEFVEGRIAEVEDNLEAAETELQELQEEYGIYAFSTQSDRLSEKYMDLQERLQDKRIERSVKLASMSERNPAIIELNNEIEALEENIQAMEQGVNRQSANPDNDLDELDDELVDDEEFAGLEQTRIGMQDIPSLSLQINKLEQEIEIQNESYELLRNQEENLSIQVAEEGSLIRMIDPPEYPDTALGRGITLQVMVAAVLAGMIGVFVAFVWSFIKNADLNDELLKEFPFLKRLQK